MQVAKIWMNMFLEFLRTYSIYFMKFHKESGNTVEECKLRVSYVAPPQPPSPVREGSDEGSSPRVSASDNGTLNTAEYTTVSILVVLLW